MLKPGEVIEIDMRKLFMDDLLWVRVKFIRFLSKEENPSSPPWMRKADLMLVEGEDGKQFVWTASPARASAPCTFPSCTTTFARASTWRSPASVKPSGGARTTMTELRKSADDLANTTDVYGLAEDMLDEYQCSMGWNHWKREELEAFCRRAVDLAEMVLELRGKDEVQHRR